MCRQRGRVAFAALLVAVVAGWVTVCVAEDTPAPATPGSSTARPPDRNGAVTTTAPQRGRAVDAERDPGGGPRATEPVFLERATTTTEHFRAGLSGWITPNAPFDHREDPGGVAVGVTMTWPGPRPGVASSGPNPWRGSASR